MNKRRKLAAGALALLVLAGVVAAGASGWLREAYLWLVTGHDPRAGLNLSTRGLDLAPGGGLGAYGYASRYRWAEYPYEYDSGFRWSDSGTYGRWPEGHARFIPYAGLGVGAIALSTDLGSCDLVLVKEKRERRSQAFTGLTFDLDDPFEDHDVTLKACYKF